MCPLSWISSRQVTGSLWSIVLRPTVSTRTRDVRTPPLRSYNLTRQNPKQSSHSRKSWQRSRQLTSRWLQRKNTNWTTSTDTKVVPVRIQKVIEQVVTQADKLSEAVNDRYFINPPPGNPDSGNKDIVYEVLSPLYGNPSSPRTLHKDMDAYFKSENQQQWCPLSNKIFFRVLSELMKEREWATLSVCFDMWDYHRWEFWHVRLPPP